VYDGSPYVNVLKELNESFPPEVIASLLSRYLPAALERRLIADPKSADAANLICRYYPKGSALLDLLDTGKVTPEKVQWMLQSPIARDWLHVDIQDRHKGMTVLHYARSVPILEMLVVAGAPLPLKGTVSKCIILTWIDKTYPMALFTRLVDLAAPLGYSIDDFEMPHHNTDDMSKLLRAYFATPTSFDVELRRWLLKNASLADIARTIYAMSEKREIYMDTFKNFLIDRQEYYSGASTVWTSDLTTTEIENKFKAATSLWGFSGSPTWQAVLKLRIFIRKLIEEEYAAAQKAKT
jgi:hypothetical protein